MADPVRLHIERMGRRGEGVALVEGRAVYVPYALPGETLMAEIEGERGRIAELISPRPDRLDPVCPYFGRCGGCAVQTLAPVPYASWKRDLVVAALRRSGVDANVLDLVDAHGEGRRRATFHARFGPSGSAPYVGFMETRAHRIVNIEFCPILAPAMAGALPAARGLADAVAGCGKPLDLVITATDTGLDVDLRGLGAADDERTRTLVAAAERYDLARLSNHGEVLVEARAPTLRMGSAHIVLPPGTFLQATRRGEEILAALVLAGVGEARKVADLFCGIGTFALRLAERTGVQAWDNDPKAVAVLTKAAQATPRLRPVAAETRDLFRRPLQAEEFAGFEAVVFDPPRAGAATQVAQIARSGVATVVAVSCDPGSYARDAATLVKAGYALEIVTPVDQFRYSAHVEIVAVFRKVRPKPKRRRILS